MTIERAVVRPMRKPWGSHDLTPWSVIPTGDDAVGELWFQRTGEFEQKSKLLLKLLFTEEPLSIQVHPDDAFAQSIGLPNGKTEAWYILSASPDAKIAIGLKAPLSAHDLREAIDDGSIAALVEWHGVREDDFFFIPAGTIHAIGAGIVLAEIQQQSDATFRLFDYGRKRELHAENAVSATRPSRASVKSWKFDGARTILVADEYFVLEKIDCGPDSRWCMDSTCETWLLVLKGDVRIGSVNAVIGGAVFLEAAHADVEVGGTGMVALLAYPGPNVDPTIFIEQNRWARSELLHPHASMSQSTKQASKREAQT
jgi:mannose-6-phosphate isomerase